MKRTLSIIMALVLTFTALTCLAGCGSSGSSNGSNGSNASGSDATGDSPSGNKGEVNVYIWGDYLAMAQDEDLMNVIDAFEDETGIKVNYTTYDTNEELYSKLTQSNVSYDVIVPSDYMISKMIKEDLLLELNYDNIPNYKYIDDRFKKLACDPDGKYTVCYSWGVTAMVYDSTAVSEKPKDWDALWNKDYEGEILMFDNSRDAMAIAMQQCGIDPSNCTKADVDKAVEKLKEQKPLLKKYVMDQVFNEMEGSQATIASYYAGDIAVMMEENEDLDYCLPESGSNLFYDAFCVPKCSKNKDNAEAFINFMQKPEIAAENCKYLRYGTPNTGAKDFLDEDITGSELTFPSDEYLNKCYVFNNVDDEVYAYMQEQFLKVKTS